MYSLRVVSIVLLLLIAGACGTSNNVTNGRFIQKRKYNKGWFFKKGNGFKFDTKLSKEKNEEESFPIAVKHETTHQDNQTNISASDSAKAPSYTTRTIASKLNLHPNNFFKIDTEFNSKIASRINEQFLPQNEVGKRFQEEETPNSTSKSGMVILIIGILLVLISLLSLLSFTGLNFFLTILGIAVFNFGIVIILLLVGIGLIFLGTTIFFAGNAIQEERPLIQNSDDTQTIEKEDVNEQSDVQTDEGQNDKTLEQPEQLNKTIGIGIIFLIIGALSFLVFIFSLILYKVLAFSIIFGALALICIIAASIFK